uniref:Uncharacterized protein LOC111109870 isoform X1 n=1 Tax=Crassostrea virginica TaxID=6565 RepID=A0A8B8BEP2_CRAVI|nr:uncharacterized protein LOC111109870 isoform X1 [Crassostrea virginica]
MGRIHSSVVCADRRGVLIFFLFLQAFNFSGSTDDVTDVYPDCPSPVQKYAFRCFTSYNTHMLNMMKSSATLFSGVDVEILRGFCSSYNQAMICIRNMKKICPKSLHQKIEVTQMNLQGAEPELSALCNDDEIYERYARHMTCLREFGSYSERCFRNEMNSSIRLMQWISEDNVYQLCSDLHRAVDCITSKIGRWCGPEAAQLIPVLLKPMVRKSTMCDVISVSDLTSTWMTTSQHRQNRQKTATSKPTYRSPEMDTSAQSQVINADNSSSSLHINLITTILEIAYQLIFIALLVTNY